MITVEEECDDGNTDLDDGCSEECKIEEDYICKGVPSNCTYGLNFNFSLENIEKTGCNSFKV